MGYEVIRVPYADGTLGEPRTFIEGWLPEDGANDDARGRAVDVHVDRGAMCVSDDMSGTIYRVRYEGCRSDVRADGAVPADPAPPNVFVRRHT